MSRSSNLRRNFEQRQDGGIHQRRNVSSRNDISAGSGFKPHASSHEISHGSKYMVYDDVPMPGTSSGSSLAKNFKSRQQMQQEEHRGHSSQSLDHEHHSGEDDNVHYQRRTTSLHKNSHARQNFDSKATVSRNIEERRMWMAQSGTSRHLPLKEHANKIIIYMERDSTLMKDTPEAEELRRDAIRDMPQCLSVKKYVKNGLMQPVRSRSSGNFGCGKILKYKVKGFFSKIGSSIRNMSYIFELWYGSLKQIEGNFGSAVSTYFKFLRWIFILNVLTTLISFGFIVIPQIIYEMRNGTDVSSEEEFSFTNIFTGAGYFTNTLLYYGSYTHGYISDETMRYSMPLAYLYTMLVIYVGTFIILSVSMARSYNKTYIETRSGLNNVFAHKIFCGWDYSIATSKAANLKMSAIYNELKEQLDEVHSHRPKFSFLDKFHNTILQLFAHLIVFSMIGATGYLMWVLLYSHRSNLASEEDSRSTALVFAVVINCIVVLFPLLFKLIAKYEDYKNPRITLYITLFRTFLLVMSIVGILLTFWIMYAQEKEEDCWETSIGQEIYRLIIFDFLFSLIVLEVVQYFLHMCFKKHVTAPEFDIAGNTLSIVYNQTLFWVGFLFAPILAIVVIVKLFLLWYIRSFTLLKFCVPAEKSWRAAQTHTWFLILTFLSLLILIGTHGYIMISVPVSKSCGPFQNYDYIRDVLLNLERGGVFWSIIDFITRPGFLWLVLIGLCMLVYYIRAKTNFQMEKVNFLKDTLQFTAEQKEFLLKYISEMSKGEWQHMINNRDNIIDPRKIAPTLH